MADISKLSRLISGVSRGVALDANTLVLQNLKISFGSANNFTFAGTLTGNRTITVPDSNVNLGLVGTAIQSDGSVAFTAAQSMGGFKLTNLGTPTANTDAATKLYVDTLAGGANLTLSNLNSPTAINQDLIFNKASALVKTADAASGASETLSVLTGTMITSGSSGNLTLGTGGSFSGSGSILLASGTTALSAATTGAVTIRSGNATVGVASSGPVSITTGTSIGAAVTGGLNLETGSSPGLAGSGNILMRSGNVNTNTSGASGTVTIASGSSVAGATGLTGLISISSGNHASPTSSAGATTVATGNQTGTAFSGTGGVTTITTGNITSGTATGTTGATSILSGNTAGSGGATGAVNIRSGNATGTNSASGSVIIQTGSVVSGARGTINMVDGSLAGALPGHVWTVSNTSTGAGNWQAPERNGIQNFIINGSIDNATASIFTTYNDSSTTRPVDGIGGSGIAVTTSLTTTAPINGSKSVLLTKPASNCQGQGWSISDITIPPEFRGKPLRHYLAYLVNSGTFVAGANGGSPTEGDLVLSFYDQTNNKLVESDNIKFLASSTTLVDDQSGNIQFDSNCTTVRMIIHVASTSTAAFELKVDSARLTNQLANQGAFIGPEQSYTPIFSNLGTPSAVDIKFRQVGPNIEIYGRFTNGTVAGGTASFTLPPGLVNALANSGIVGTYGHQGSATGNTLFMGAGGNTVFFSMSNWQVAATGTNLATSGFTTIQMSVPIAGWTGSAKLSEPGDDRPFYVSAGIISGQTIPNNVQTKVNFTDVLKDFQGSYDSVNQRFRVYSSDTYRISGKLNAGYTTVVFALAAILYVNGSPANRVQESGKSGTANTSETTHFDFTIDLKAGDYVEIYASQSSGSPLGIRGNNSAGQLSNLIIEKAVPNSQKTAANELIAVSAANTNAQSFPHNTRTLINWNAESIDTHGGLSGTTYTAYVAQVVEVSMQIGVAGLGNGTQFTLVPAVTHTGTVVDERYFEMQGTTTTAFTSYPTAPVTSQIFRMKAGDTITASLYHFNSIGTAVTSFNANRTYLNIKRIG